MTRPGYYEDSCVLHQCPRADCHAYHRTPSALPECEGTLSLPHAPKQMRPVDDQGQEPTAELVVDGYLWRDGALQPVEYSHELGCFVTPGWAR
jgi:hypothetical protein